jgi:hypothetical protein
MCESTLHANRALVHEIRGLSVTSFAPDFKLTHRRRLGLRAFSAMCHLLCCEQNAGILHFAQNDNPASLCEEGFGGFDQGGEVEVG